MRTCDQPALGWTVVLRRQPVRIVEARPEGGYTDVFELICSDCGDHPTWTIVTFHQAAADPRTVPSGGGRRSL